VIPRTLPRGPHSLAREVVLASQRGRLLDAMAEEVAARGYGAATVAGVIARAGISRKTFYELFRDKEECFLAAYDTGVELVLQTLREAGREAPHPLEVLRARVRAYLEVLAAEPAFARTFLLEVGAAGPRARERRRAVHDAFAAQIREQAAQVGGPSDLSEELALALVGATDELVSRWVADGRTARLPELEPVLMQVNVALLSAAT
jgi:AcrR family transcriptional regulator